MELKDAIKLLLIVGGIVELIVGILFLFLDIFLKQLGLENIPIFAQMADTFLLCYGILLIYSKQDIEKFLIIPLINILVRIIMIVFSLINIIEYPEFFIILLFAIPYDSVLSLLMLILLKKSGIIFKKY